MSRKWSENINIVATWNKIILSEFYSDRMSKIWCWYWSENSWLHFFIPAKGQNTGTAHAQYTSISGYRMWLISNNVSFITQCQWNTAPNVSIYTWISLKVISLSWPNQIPPISVTCAVNITSIRIVWMPLRKAIRIQLIFGKMQPVQVSGEQIFTARQWKQAIYSNYGISSGE